MFKILFLYTSHAKIKGVCTCNSFFRKVFYKNKTVSKVLLAILYSLYLFYVYWKDNTIDFQSAFTHHAHLGVNMWIVEEMYRVAIQINGFKELCDQTAYWQI